MNVFLIVYITGVLITAILIARKEIKKGYITYKDLLGDLLLCVLSWVPILIVCVAVLIDNLDKELWRRKEDDK